MSEYDLTPEHRRCSAAHAARAIVTAEPDTGVLEVKLSGLRLLHDGPPVSLEHRLHLHLLGDALETEIASRYGVTP